MWSTGNVGTTMKARQHEKMGSIGTVFAWIKVLVGRAETIFRGPNRERRVK